MDGSELTNISSSLALLANKHLTGTFCLYVYGNTFHAEDCERSYPCGVCRIGPKQHYYLKGLEDSKTGSGGAFDSLFYFDGYKNEKPLFR